MPKLHRKDDGKPLRAAMARAGLSIPALAEATKDVDPGGKGVSAATVGNLVGRGKTARNRFELTTAVFTAQVLREPLDDLFVIPEHFTAPVKLQAVLRAAKALHIPLQDLLAMPKGSTSNIERSTPNAEEE